EPARRQAGREAGGVLFERNAGDEGDTAGVPVPHGGGQGSAGGERPHVQGRVRKGGGAGGVRGDGEGRARHRPGRRAGEGPAGGDVAGDAGGVADRPRTGPEAVTAGGTRYDGGGSRPRSRP